MNCRVTDLRSKEVVNMKDGSRLGAVCDVEMDMATGQITALIIYGKNRAFGVLGREEDLVIGWKNIDVVGDDTILVHYEPAPPRGVPRRRGYMEGFFK